MILMIREKSSDLHIIGVKLGNEIGRFGLPNFDVWEGLCQTELSQYQLHHCYQSLCLVINDIQPQDRRQQSCEKMRISHKCFYLFVYAWKREIFSARKELFGLNKMHIVKETLGPLETKWEILFVAVFPSLSVKVCPAAVCFRQLSNAPPPPPRPPSFAACVRAFPGNPSSSVLVPCLLHPSKEYYSEGFCPLWRVLVLLSCFSWRAEASSHKSYTSVWSLSDSRAGHFHTHH